MKTVQLTVEIKRFPRTELSKSPKLFIAGSPQRERLESEPEKLKDNPTFDEFMQNFMDRKNYSFSVDIDGKEEELYDKINDLFREKETKYKWRGWVLRDDLFCRLVDFWRLPSSDPQKIASNKDWWNKIKDLKRTFKALNQCDQRKTLIDYNYEGCTLQFTPKEIKVKVQEMICKIVKPFKNLDSNSVSRKVYDLVDAGDFQQAEIVLNSMKRAREQDSTLASIYAQQIYTWCEEQHLIREQIKSNGQIVQQGTETHVFQLISESLEYADLLPSLEIADTHHERGKRKINSYRTLKKNYTTEEGVVIMVLKT